MIAAFGDQRYPYSMPAQETAGFETCGKHDGFDLQGFPGSQNEPVDHADVIPEHQQRVVFNEVSSPAQEIGYNGFDKSQGRQHMPVSRKELTRSEVGRKRWDKISNLRCVEPMDFCAGLAAQCIGQVIRTKGIQIARDLQLAPRHK